MTRLTFVSGNQVVVDNTVVEITEKWKQAVRAASGATLDVVLTLDVNTTVSGYIVILTRNIETMQPVD